MGLTESVLNLIQLGSVLIPESIQAMPSSFVVIGRRLFFLSVLIVPGDEFLLTESVLNLIQLGSVLVPCSEQTMLNPFIVVYISTDIPSFVFCLFRVDKLATLAIGCPS